MPHERRSVFDVRHHGIRRPLALAAVAVLALNVAHASAWASTVLTTITGDSSAGAPGFGGDGGPATAAQLDNPAGVAVDGTGNVFVADTANQRIRRIDGATGVLTTIAGGGAEGAPGFAGDGGPATAAQLNNPAGVAVDGAGNVVVADTANQRIRRVDGTTGVITTIAGGATESRLGDGGPATRARLANPSGVAVDGGGNVFVADTANQRVRRIDAARGVITTIAGGAAQGTPGFGGDGGPAVSAQLASPAGVTVDGTGNVAIADTANQRIRGVDAASGVITTLAGGAQAVIAGGGADQGAPAGVAAPPSLAPPPGPERPSEGGAGPLGVAVDRAGAVYIANTPRNRVDKVVGAYPTSTPPDAPAPSDPASLCQLVEGGGVSATSTSPSWMTRTVSLSTPTATPGEPLGVQGNGFGSGQQLTVTLCSVPTVLGTITAGPQGSYRANVKLPANVAPGAHHVVLSDATGNAAVALRVIQARAGAGADPGAGSDATGFGVDSTDDSGIDDGTGDLGTDTLNPDDFVTGDPGTDDLGSGAGADLTGSDIAGSDIAGSDIATNTNGMPTTGAELMPLFMLGGAALKLGGALVLAGRKRSPAS